MADDSTEEKRKEAFKVIERQKDLKEFIEDAAEEDQQTRQGGCPACGEKDWTCRSTQYYLLYVCNKCGQKWEALVTPNTTGAAVLPQDPIEKALESAPQHRDPRKQRRIQDD